jgi:tRNA pseudouridine13 synthase
MSLPRAHGGPVARGVLRATPEDFRVIEELGFEPDGEGEHLWLLVRKREWNTTDLALALAKLSKLPLRAVGYSGLKDRIAVTDQWFSLHLPGKADPDLSALPDGVTLLRAVRHRRKLNRGTHRFNHFDLYLRDLAGDTAALRERLDAVAREGVPNYFGEQRFGRGGDNASRASAWLLGQGEAPRKPALKSLWLSAVRSELFNQVLARRVQEHCWQRALGGDLLQPDGSRGLFLADEDSAAAERVRRGEVHPTAPMPGAGGMASSGACAALEQAVLAPHAALIEALAAQGVEAARRATRLPVRDLAADIHADGLHLRMTLPAGSFATTVLAELIDTVRPDNRAGERDRGEHSGG